MAAQQYSMFEGSETEENPSAKKSASSFSSISISKTINGNQQAVFDHWLIPVFIGEWMFGRNVQAEEIISLENTVRRNGEFDFRVKRRGSEVSHRGEYTELAIPNRLAFTWIESTSPDAETQVAVQFSAAGDKTKLRVNLKVPSELNASRDKIKKIWTARCKALAEKFK